MIGSKGTHSQNTIQPTRSFRLRLVSFVSTLHDLVHFDYGLLNVGFDYALLDVRFDYAQRPSAFYYVFRFNPRLRSDLDFPFENLLANFQIRA